MKVLIIGAGGREHALAWRLRQSPRVEHVWCAPGNAGIALTNDAECVPLSTGNDAANNDVANVDALVALAERLQPDLTVIGPEIPLQAGVVDAFTARGLRVFGPTKAAAQLESSKSFAKEFMQRHNIPTAHYAIITAEGELKDALDHFSAPIVVKADGLAAGKGVVIAATKEEADAVAREMLSGKMLGDAGARVVLEEFLEGEEVSFLVMSDGERVAPLVAAQDHKRVGDGDTGPNTGGMGAYSTDVLLEPAMRDWLIHHVAQPVVAGMKAEGAPYRGILYCGLMMTARGPMVLEFNCRFGDPETQPILMRLADDCDLLAAFEASVDGHVSDGDLKWSTDATCCVVLASGGYPGEFSKGKIITGLDAAAKLPDVKVFHAGTAKNSAGELVTAGGRVLGVAARGATLEAAVDRAYEACGLIKFDGMQYRKDIAAKALNETTTANAEAQSSQRK